MRLDSKYKVREVAGESVILRQGRDGADLTRLISLNTAARLLYERLSGRDFTEEDAAAVLMGAYGIGQDTARKDASKWIEDMRSCGLLKD